VDENESSPGLQGRQWAIDTFGMDRGIKVWGALQAFLHLVVGWPAYLLIGATGGSDRGMTNHFYPDPLTTPNQPKKELFPGNWKEKVYKSDIGIAAVVGSLIAWAVCHGPAEVMALYGGPLLVINAWLVLYTWYVIYVLVLRFFLLILLVAARVCVWFFGCLSSCTD
jgi:omega-6 fatty acid desaturase (delta-12 desaturase)